jgi:hypothetical protein
MPMELSNLVDSRIGKSVVIFGSSPSLLDITSGNHPQPIGIYIGDSMIRTRIRTEDRFFVRANSLYPNLTRASHLRDLNELQPKLVIAETVMESETPVRNLLANVRDSLGFESYVFDQRHFKGQECDPKSSCCRSLRMRPPDFITIQELVSSRFGLDGHYSSGSTVAVHALALALLLGCKEIHIAGVDIPSLKKDYIYAPLTLSRMQKIIRALEEIRYEFLRVLKSYQITKIPFIVLGWIRRQLVLNSTEPSAFSEDLDSILEDFAFLFGAAKRAGAKIYICSSVSNLNRLEGVAPCPNLIAK